MPRSAGRTAPSYAVWVMQVRARPWAHNVAVLRRSCNASRPASSPGSGGSYTSHEDRRACWCGCNRGRDTIPSTVATSAGKSRPERSRGSAQFRATSVLVLLTTPGTAPAPKTALGPSAVGWQGRSRTILFGCSDVTLEALLHEGNGPIVSSYGPMVMSVKGMPGEDAIDSAYESSH
jgi:hypothetical protein